MQTLPQQSTSKQQTKQLSCCRWQQYCLHRPGLNTLASMCHATRSRCRPSRRWPYPCSNTFRWVTSMQEVGGARVVEAVDADWADKVVTHFQTTCKLWEPCQLCLANSSLMEEAWHRSHPLLVFGVQQQNRNLISPMCTNSTTIGMCVSCVDSTLRMATHPPNAHSAR
jgi:hypothetical protein